VKEKLKTVTIETPEHFELRLPLAGIGMRFIAYAIDRLIQAGLVLGVVLTFMLLALAAGRVVEFAGWLNKSVDFLGGWGVALLIILYSVIVVGYFIFFEYFRSGSTPGKRSQGIRVIRKDGRPLTFADSAIRNILRIFELEFYPLGLIVMFIDSRNRRLGDFSAGTLVVKESEARAPGRYEAAIDPGVPEEEIRIVARKMAARDYALITRFLSRRDELDPGHRENLAWEICDRLFQNAERPLPTALDPEQTIQASAALYREKTRIL
jgi:uncharacterized RDD family membrane protein YckC